MSADVMKDGDASPFMFDVNFAAPEAIVGTVAMPDHEAAVRAAEEQGYERGLSEGRAGEETRLANEAKRIAVAAEKILAAIDSDRVRLEREAADLALSIATNLSGEAIQQHPLADIEKLISDCLAPLRKTPHLVVRLPEKDVDAITETVGKFAREAGFEGRFVVLGEPDFAPGDCRIEWADGGIVRDRTKAEDEMRASFAVYFKALGVDAGDATSSNNMHNEAVKGPDNHE